MELQHFSHQHLLVLCEEQRNGSEKVHCCGCGDEVVSGPTFSCVECEFHLHKQCAEAPSELNHPFHRDHSFNLLKKHPHINCACHCDFCGQLCENFVYDCSCGLDLHIKCALFSYNIAQRKFDHLQHISYKHPSISFENLSKELKKAKCFACRTLLVDSAYLSLDFGFSLHKKCAELPLEINHLSKHPHSLFLQFNSDRLPCRICICKRSQLTGLVYCCSICKFVFHIDCVLPPLPIIEDHEHLFTKLWLRQNSFTCDACGTLGKSICYICSTCSLIVHRDCTSLPCIIKHRWHHHPMLHKYSLLDNVCGSMTMDCGTCHEEVNKECGSYYCSLCNFVLHVNCALEYYDRYYEIGSKEDYEKALVVETGDPPFSVIKDGEIKHFSHEHNLVLSEVVKEDRCCDCCSILITTSFYLCLHCHFSLHKSCAELPRKKQLLIHFHQAPHNLIPDCSFRCKCCAKICLGFAYKCLECSDLFCVRCAQISLTCSSQGHQHLLLLYNMSNNWQCDACGETDDGTGNCLAYRCKDCFFYLHGTCAFLPQTARHKCDEHLLTLNYHENNDYPKNHYCDICEEDRNPELWFYHCAICDTSAHPRCILGQFPFVKLGSKIFFQGHQHPLVVVRKVYDYPECCKRCGQQCSDDQALECPEPRCNFIIHLKKCGE